MEKGKVGRGKGGWLSECWYVSFRHTHTTYLIHFIPLNRIKEGEEICM